MELGNLKVVKLGGSVITVKDRPRSLRRDVIQRLLRELGRYYGEREGRDRIVLVHGGGSYGHPVVKECVSRLGRIDESCFVETADSMDTLDHVLRKYAVAAGLPVVSLPPRSFCTMASGSPVCHTEALSTLLHRGLVPLAYGDVVASDRGFEVLSGDALAWHVAQKLGASEIVFVTDVDALYDRDPKVYPGARRIARAPVDEILGFLSESSSEVDVTGGMFRKLYEGRRLGLRGVKVKIVSGFVEGELYRALASDEFGGSIVWY